MPKPILYTFRRCPYAMRARFALKLANIACVVREVDLKAKPEELLKISPKATVPVLVLENNDLLDESMKIVTWALAVGESFDLTNSDKMRADEIVIDNDTKFVRLINYYKYPERYPEQDLKTSEKELMRYLEKIDERLKEHSFLLGPSMSYADIAVFPFVRQAVQISPEKFQTSSLARLLKWLDYFLMHPLFEQIMIKHRPWMPGDQEISL